jgi:4-amino-4-deoxy-L-arabinose transferase-like glycosyltransferase
MMVPEYSVPPLRDRLAVAAALLLAVAWLSQGLVGLPHFWDAAEYYVPSAISLWRNGYDISAEPTLHPPLFYLALAVSYGVFGYSLQASHLVVIFFAYATAYYTYLLGSHLRNQRTGVAAAVFLISSPLYVAQLGIVTLEGMVAALMACAVYFYLRERWLPYAAFGVLLALTKVSGCLIFPVLAAYTLAEWRMSRRSGILFRLGMAVLPTAAFLIYLSFSRLTFGYYLPQYSGTSVLDCPGCALDGVHIFNLGVRAWQALLMQHNWALTGFILCGLLAAVAEAYKGSRQRPLAVGLPLLGLTAAAAAQVIALESAYPLTPYMAPPILVMASMLVAFGLLWSRGAELRLIPLAGAIVAFCLAHSILISTFQFPRYMLPVMPMFCVLGAFYLDSLCRGRTMLRELAVLAVVALFVSQWHVVREFHVEDHPGLEANLEYLDVIKTHQEAAAYLSGHYGNRTILTGWYYTRAELTVPEEGYVTRKLKVISERRYQKLNSCEGFDVVYFTPYSSFPQDFFQTFSRQCNLTLEKRFEHRGKYAEIWVRGG